MWDSVRLNTERPLEAEYIYFRYRQVDSSHHLIGILNVVPKDFLQNVRHTLQEILPGN